MSEIARRTLLLALLLVILSGHGLRAREAKPAEQARVLLQALSFDRNLAARREGGYLIMVVHAPVGAAREARELADAFAVVAAERHPQIGLRLVTHPWGRIMPLAKRIEELGVDAIYVHRSADRFVNPLLAVARKASLPTLAGSDALANSGIGLTVVGVEEPSLGINRRAAEEGHLDLPSSLLRVAQIFGE